MTRFLHMFDPPAPILHHHNPFRHLSAPAVPLRRPEFPPIGDPAFRKDLYAYQPPISSTYNKYNGFNRKSLFSGCTCINTLPCTCGKRL